MSGHRRGCNGGRRGHVDGRALVSHAAAEIARARGDAGLAGSINGLFFRNAVSFGLLALECPGIDAAFAEGQTAEISLDDWSVRNRETGAVVAIKPLPERLLSLMTGGGIFPLLEAEGLIAPRPPLR